MVAGTNPAAHALGLCAGMALAHATALSPGLTVLEADPDAEQAALTRLATWCHRITPLTATDGTDGLWLDVTGCAHLSGGEAAMLDALARDLATFGLHARLALADTPGAAHALSRFGTACPAPTGPVPDMPTPRTSPGMPSGAPAPGKSSGAPVPGKPSGAPAFRVLSGASTTRKPPGPPGSEVAPSATPRRTRSAVVLSTRSDTVLSTRLDTVHSTPSSAHHATPSGAIILVPPGEQRAALTPLPVRALRLPSGAVATLRRLGFDTIGALLRVPRAPLSRRLGPDVCRRLDQATGAQPEPIVPLVPAELLQHRLCFLEPLLTAEALGTAITHLLEPLCTRMEQAGQGARRLDLLFERVDGETQALRIGTARPTRDAPHLARLLLERLDTIDPGLGIEAMRLIAPLAEPLRWVQRGAHETPDVSALVDRLSNRLGAEQVYRVEPVESDVPERSVRRVPALAAARGSTWPDGARPTRLLTPPRPIEAMALLPDHPPVAFTWQRRRHRIRRADGPERVYGEWWRREAESHAVRDYFQVEDEEGRRFWLFRQGDGVDPQTGGLSWYLHGLF